MEEKPPAIEPGTIVPVPRRPNDHAAVAVHEHLRALILNGTLPPGAVLNQVELAPQLGVSRTPIREAIRMLQEEGLVDAEPQKRARVVGFDPGHLEAVYVQRILLESLAARLSAPRTTEAEAEGLEDLLRGMRELAVAEDLDAWQDLHREFHRRLVQGTVGLQLERAIIGQMERSERYRFLYQVARSWEAGNAEHESIVAAYRERDGDEAARCLVAHLARTALTLIAQLAPTYDPTALRAAVAVSSPL
jgi:DNA-binding GntR family transcriptional regulator